jgi:hypothetical protein
MFTVRSRKRGSRANEDYGRAQRIGPRTGHAHTYLGSVRRCFREHVYRKRHVWETEDPYCATVESALQIGQRMELRAGEKDWAETSSQATAFCVFVALLVLDPESRVAHELPRSLS